MHHKAARHLRSIITVLIPTRKTGALVLLYPLTKLLMLDPCLPSTRLWLLVTICNAPPVGALLLAHSMQTTPHLPAFRRAASPEAPCIAAAKALSVEDWQLVVLRLQLPAEPLAAPLPLCFDAHSLRHELRHCLPQLNGVLFVMLDVRHIVAERDFGLVHAQNVQFQQCVAMWCALRRNLVCLLENLQPVFTHVFELNEFSISTQRS